MSWSLRAATGDDLAQIMDIEESVFVNDAWSSASMAADLASNHTVYIVVTANAAPERIVGYAGLLAPAGSGDADIQTIAVRDEARGNGLGRSLMNTLIGEARSRRVGEIFLEVRADNPVARALYASLGFEEIAVRPRYYQPDGIDAVVMRSRLTTPQAAPAGDAESVPTVPAAPAGEPPTAQPAPAGGDA